MGANVFSLPQTQRDVLRMSVQVIGSPFDSIGLRRGPTEIVLAVVTVAAIAAMIAVRTSRWYVAGAGSGLIVLLISGVSSTHDFDISFAERLLETALGAALALTFGVVIPAGLRWLTAGGTRPIRALQIRP